MKLANWERETIINFNEAEKIAYIYTHNKTWQKRLSEIGIKGKKANRMGGMEYELPKKMIKLPTRPRKMSDEARAKIGERLAAARANINSPAQKPLNGKGIRHKKV